MVQKYFFWESKGVLGMSSNFRGEIWIWRGKSIWSGKTFNISGEFPLRILKRTKSAKESSSFLRGSSSDCEAKTLLFSFAVLKIHQNRLVVYDISFSKYWWHSKVDSSLFATLTF